MTQRKNEIEIMHYIIIRQTVRLKRGWDRITTTTNDRTTNISTGTGALPYPTSKIPWRAEEDEVLVVGCYDALHVALRFVEKL